MAFLTPPGIGFARLYEYPAQLYPDKVALIDDTDQVTFAAADAMANRLAHAFTAAGARPGDRVALILPNVIAFIITEIAIIKNAMVKVPLNIRFHVNEVLYSLRDCEPTLLVCDESFVDAVLDRRDELPSLKEVFVVGGGRDGCHGYEATVAPGETTRAHADYPPDAPFLIRYTGGTTGRPKGIVHTERSFINVNLDLIREFKFVPSDVTLNLGHLSHGLNFIYAAHYAKGSTQVLRERFEPERVLEDIERYRVTFAYMVPTMVQRVLRADVGTADVSSLRLLMYGSAPMPVPVLRDAVARFGDVCNQVYTSSEAPPITTLLRPDEHIDLDTGTGNRLESCGREVITMSLRLVDDGGQDIASGEVGEIAVRTVNNMAEYWRLPEETAASLVDGWFRTGDMAQRDAAGYLYIVDRKKDVIITGGFNVYPKEVEDVLYKHPAVAQAAVVGIADEDLGEAIKAFVVLKPGEQATADDLIELCRDELASYKKPRVVGFLEELPLSPVGKVMRRALRAQ